MFTRFCLISCLCGLLCACSSGGADTPNYCITSCDTTTVEPQASLTRALSTSGGYSGDVSGAAYDAAAGNFTLTTDSLDVQMTRFAAADHGDLLAMRDASNLHNAYFGQGQGTQVIVYSGGNVGSVTSFASYARTGATDLPLTGSGQFVGEYAGFTSTRRINGAAQLDVDFADATVSGRITGRIFRQRADNIADVVNPLSDVILEETSLANDGSFQGITGGGQIVNGQSLWNPATGTYEGLIGGATAAEAVGSVTLTHNAPSGVMVEEIGGFLATR